MKASSARRAFASVQEREAEDDQPDENDQDPRRFDRILSSEEALTPSSGFVAGVMDAVRTASEQPAPLPFPWRHFLPGVAACVVWAVAGVVLLGQITRSEALAARLAALGPELGAAVVVLALCLAPIYGRRLIQRGRL